MPWTWHTGTVKKIELLSSHTRQFTLEIEGLESFDFKAGQFITMDLPISEKRLQRWRSYSIANAPTGNNLIELCIVHLEGGKGSSYLFEDIKVGSTIKFKGPTGAFTLPEKIDTDLVMICTGTGIAPFRSMIADMVNGRQQHNNVRLIFGTRTQADILYREEFEHWASKHNWFSYDIALSRETLDGYKGYVHGKYQNNSIENKQFYLCGWQNMVDQARTILEGLGCSKKKIHYELYG